MRLLDRALRRLGLQRISQHPIKHYRVERRLYGPTTVFIEFRNGHRVAGELSTPKVTYPPDSVINPVPPWCRQEGP